MAVSYSQDAIIPETGQNPQNYFTDCFTFLKRRRPPYSREAAQRLAAYPGPADCADIRIIIGQQPGKKSFCRDSCWVRWQGQTSFDLAKHWVNYPRANPPEVSGVIPLCVPPGDDPTVYDWRIVRGYTPWIIRLGGIDKSAVEWLALLLLESGAAKVRASGWGADFGGMVVFTTEGLGHD